MALIHGADFGSDDPFEYGVNHFEFVRKLNANFEPERKSKELQDDNELDKFVNFKIRGR